jgi:hypothetical protein
VTNLVFNVGGFADFDKEFVQIVNNVPWNVPRYSTSATQTEGDPQDAVRARHPDYYG